MAGFSEAKSMTSTEMLFVPPGTYSLTPREAEGERR